MIMINWALKQSRALYDKTLGYAEHKNAIWILAVVSFVESSFFPIPPDILLIPMIIAAREKAFLYAFVCTIASVLGGLLGYALGWGFYDVIGDVIVSFYGYADQFDNFKALYETNGAWIVGMAGMTPFPYKVVTILSGIVGMNIVLFAVISLLSRGARFFLLAILLWFFGEQIKRFIEKYFALLTLLFFALLVAGFALLRYI